MNQAPFLIKGWLQCLHSSLRSMARSRAESDIALLHAGREHECVSRPSVPGTVLPMMPTTLLLNVALRDGRAGRLASLHLRTHASPPEAWHKDCPIGSLVR